MPAACAKDASRGQALLLLSALAFSTAGFFTRKAPVEIWPLLFWRNLFGAVALLPMLLMTSSTPVTDLWRFTSREWAAIVVTSVATCCYLAAYTYTSVAHVSIIYATAPMMTAALAWLSHREIMPRRTLVASILALAGVGVTIGGSLGSGSMLGDGLALLMTLLFSAVTVIARGGIGIVSTSLVSTLLTVAVAMLLGVGAGSNLLVGWHDILWLAAFGVIAMAIALPCFLLGARQVTAGRAMLISAAEMPLGPLWVWLAFGETPTPLTFVGGAIVAGAIALDLRAVPAAA